MPSECVSPACKGAPSARCFAFGGGGLAKSNVVLAVFLLIVVSLLSRCHLRRNNPDRFAAALIFYRVPPVVATHRWLCSGFTAFSMGLAAKSQGRGQNTQRPFRVHPVFAQVGAGLGGVPFKARARARMYIQKSKYAKGQVGEQHAFAVVRQIDANVLWLSLRERLEAGNKSTANAAQKKSQAVRLGIKDLIVAMDQGGVKHCQRGTLKQRGHSRKY